MTAADPMTPMAFVGVVVGTIALLCLGVVIAARKITPEQLRRWGGEE